MADDFGLISAAEREHVLDELRRRAAVGAISSGELGELTERVHAAQTHAGLEAILRELPAEQPWRMPVTPPPVVGPGLPWWQRPAVVMAAAALVGTFIFVAAIVAIGADDGEPSSTGRTIIELPPAEVPTSTTEPAAVQTQPPTTAAPTTTTTIVLPLEPSFVDTPAEMLLVGQDIQPGRYKSTNQMCFWERRSGTDPGFDEVIASGMAEGGPTVVDIAPGDVAFSSDDCDWKPYVPAAAPATTIGSGDWLVGSDVAAGTYERSDFDGIAPGLCWWERAHGFGHDYDEIIDWGNPSGPDTVRVNAGERFSSAMCGTWTKTG